MFFNTFYDVYHFLDTLPGSVLAQKYENGAGKTSDKGVEYFHASHTTDPE